MILLRPISILAICVLACTAVYAQSAEHAESYANTALPTNPTPQEEVQNIKALKMQLYKDLDSGDIQSSSFDDNTEFDIAKIQMQFAQYYLSQNDRENAIISAIIARKILQKLYNNNNDPRLIPVYSLLVQAYASSVDIDNPHVDSSDAAKAKMYRELIDHIHAR